MFKSLYSTNRDNQEERNVSQIVAYSLIFSPIFSNYVLFKSISIGDILFLTGFLFLVSSFIFNLKSLIVIILTMFWLCLCFMLNGALNVNASFYRSALFYICCIIIINNSQPFNKVFLDKYTNIALFCSIVIIFQWILFVSTGDRYIAQLPLKTIEPDTLDIAINFRTGGIFREPSYYTLFITPIIFYLGYMKRYFAYGLLIIGAFISTSSMILPLILFERINSLLRERNRPIILISQFIILTIIIFIIIFFFENSHFIVRIMDIFKGGGTLNERLYNTLDYFNIYGILPSKQLFENLLQAKQEGVWLSSAIYISATFGLLSLFFIVFSFRTLGLILGSYCFFLLFTTSIFSSAYSPLILFSFMLIYQICRKQKRLHNIFNNL